MGKANQNGRYPAVLQDDLQGTTERMDGRDVAVGEATRQGIEQQIGRPGHGGAGGAARAASASSTTPGPGPRRPAKIAAPNASRYVTRASAPSSCSRRRAASNSNGGASLHAGTRTRSAPAAGASWCGGAGRAAHSFGGRHQYRCVVRSARVELGLGGCQRALSPPDPDPPSARSPRSRNTAAAGHATRACARAADHSSSAATSSSAPGAAFARCQARRSGSAVGSVASARARCASRRSACVAAR